MATVLELYDKLKPKLGELEARALLEYVESSVERHAATKADLQQAVLQLRAETQQWIGELRAEIEGSIAGLRAETQQWIGELRSETREAVATLRSEMQESTVALRGEMRQMGAELRVEFQQEVSRVEGSLRKEIHEARSELLKWSFAFWVGNVAVLSGILFAMLRTLR